MNSFFQPDLLQNRGLKLSHLRLLCLLVETGQIGAAADRLGIAQSAASRLLAEVEAIVGHPVHERVGRGIRLTEVGTAIARRAQRIRMELSDAARELAEISGGTTGHVRIGSVTGPALDRVLPALRAARLAFPQVTAEVVVATSDVLAGQLVSGGLDFAISRLPDGSERRLLQERTLGAEPLSLVARRDHPLMARPGFGAKDLMAFDWVMPGRETLLTRTVLAQLAQLTLPEPPQRLSTASFLLTLALLQQSNAIAPLATAVAEAFTRAPDAPYVTLPIDLGLVVAPYGLITRVGLRLPPVAQRLADMIVRQGPLGEGETLAQASGPGTKVVM